MRCTPAGAKPLEAGGVDLYTFQHPSASRRMNRFVKASATMEEDGGGEEDEIKAKRDRNRRFNSDEHPRGQPDNAGQFVSSGGRDAVTAQHFNGDFKVEIEDQPKI